MRVCRYCGEEKPLSMFYKSSGWKCKTCKDAQRLAYYQSDKGKAEKLANKRRHTLRKYGLTEEQYQQMLDAQGGVCAICGGVDKGKSLAVDHDHNTGENRGLLCFQCNVVIGNSRENVETLQSAIDYLTFYKDRG